MRQIILVMLCFMFLASCISSTKGSLIDETAVNKIEIKKSTKSDILKLFGAPDRIVDTGLAGAAKSQTTGDVDLKTRQEVTVGKNEEIYIYEYVENKLSIFYIINRTSQKKNTLMVWINKDTGIVQDYGYKKEIK